MLYAVRITRTIGPPLEACFFAALPEARQHFEQLCRRMPYERVLIFRLEKPSLSEETLSRSEETLLDVYFKEGINYTIPRVSKSAVSQSQLSKSSIPRNY